MNSQQLILPIKKGPPQGDQSSNARAKKKSAEKKRGNQPSLSSAQYPQRPAKQSNVTSVRVVGGSKARQAAMGRGALERQGHHSKKASQVVLENDAVDPENEGNAD